MILLRKYKLFIILVIFTFICWKSALVAQEIFQLKQSRQALRILKSLSYWEKRDSFVRPEKDTVVNMTGVDIYSEESFQSLDYIFEHYRTKDNSYFHVRLLFEKFSVIPVGLFADVQNEKIYCLALKNDNASRGLCKKLGAADSPVPDKNLVIKKDFVPYIDVMDAYLIDTSSVAPMF
ncbi:MAG: hypothetical protein FWF35_02505 [Elusimicrobia bacterium]|nr:hypothetical protein [Elusimicrobiota bacterium]